MPAVDLEGKLILADRDRLTWNPDGHGGTIRALARSGMLEDMRARGVEHISYFQVDNPLVPPLDPVFLGFHVDADSDMSNKMVRKRDAGEKLGHFGLVGGRLHVVEYSDMPKELAEAKNSDGRLRFEAGSIAIHLIARRFVERLSAGDRVGGPPDTDRSGLPLHRAEKKIPYMDAEGRRHEPDEPNGIKFEMFIFDALPMARNPVVLEIDRAEEFSPVKNADGEDSPATARHDMVRLAARRLEEVGVKVPRDPHGEPRFPVEISPLAAGTPEELRALVRRRGIQAVTGELYLGPEKT